MKCQMFSLHTLFVLILSISFPGCIYISDPKDAPEAFQNPEIKKAYRDKEAIAAQVAVFQKASEELHEHVNGASSQLMQVQDTGTRAHFMTTIRSLRQQAQEILDNAPRFLEAMDQLSADIGQGRQSFSAAAGLFETFAAEEPYESIADDYRQIVKLFTTLAERCETAQTQILAKHNRAEFLESLQFIRHQERLLNRFEAALLTTFDDTDLEEVERYLMQLSSYAKEYEGFRGQIRDLNRLVPLLQPRGNGDPAPPVNGNSPQPTPAAGKPAEDSTVAQGGRQTECPAASSEGEINT